MSLPERPSPIGKRVALFVTCMVDMLYPQTGMAAVQLLERLGCTVDFPQAQTCCGQPAFNAGHWPEAQQVARHFLAVFESAEVIVTPSGSCCAMVRHEYPRLLADTPADAARAQALAARTWELTEFIVDGLGIGDLSARLPTPQTFAFHDACHGLRQLGLGSAARALVAGIDNATLSELPGHDVCCGFGGLFSIKLAAVSGAMLENKLTAIEACPAQVLCGDVSCMTHINGGLARRGAARRVQHVADVLAGALLAARSEE